MNNEPITIGNKSLTESIACRIIIHHFSGETELPLAVIQERVEDAHEAQGGVSIHTTTNPTSKALYALKTLGFADNPKKGYWNIKSVEDMCFQLLTLSRNRNR